MTKLLLYYNTLKHLKLKQIYYRFKLILKTKLINLLNINIEKKYLKSINKNIDRINNINNELFNDIDKNIINYLDTDLLSNEFQRLNQSNFKFLNVKHQFDSIEDINWDLKSNGQLWKFNLNYFDFSIDLGMFYRIEKRFDIYNTFKRIVNSWIDNTSFNYNDQCHPYVNSLRVVNWIYSYYLFKEQIVIDKKFNNKFKK